jgi:hypothetical protein
MTAPIAVHGDKKAPGKRQESTSMSTDIDTIYVGGEWVTPFQPTLQHSRRIRFTHPLA